MARRSSSMRRTAARARMFDLHRLATPCRPASPTAGKAGTGAPSTSGAWTRSGRTRCRTTVIKDICRERRRRAVLGLRPGDHPLGLGRLAWHSRLCFWFTELGIKQIHIAPDVNYANAVHADQWIPVLAQHRRRAAAGHRLHVDQGRHLRPGVPGHPRGRLRLDFKYYVMGGEDGVPKTPKWAEAICGVPSYADQGARALLGQARRVHRALQRRLLHPVLLRARAGAPGSGASGHAGRGQARARTSSSSSNGRSTAWSR